MKVLVTGANGLIGRSLCAHLERLGHIVIRAVRQARAPGEIGVGDVDGRTSWAAVLVERPDLVVHLAARVHVLKEDEDAALPLYASVNRDGSLNLAKQCAEAGVKRLLFVSSIKVMGEGQPKPYREDGPVAPEGAYARSKWSAEEGLRALCATTGMDLVILRPPLVYGPGVGANFLRLLRAVERGWVLPFGAIDNRRSFIYLENLIDIIALCLTHPAAAGRIYLVSDGEDVSTPELVRRVAAALGKSPRLVPVPAPLIALAGRLLGREKSTGRLLGSLAVDISLLQRELGWQPPHTMTEGLRATAAWYLQAGRGAMG